MVKVIFIHPDLGIGGAERAVIDAAIALQSKGHIVQFYTAHHDTNHCFEETRNGTVNVTVVGDWLPRSIGGKFQALFAYFRMIVVALYVVLFCGSQYDVIFCDQISACIPVLRLRKCKILFYCHFPDLLLTERNSRAKRIYRAGIDWLEEKTTGMADRVLVNSKFTAQVFQKTFKSLQHISSSILYPVPDIKSLSSDSPNCSIDELFPSSSKHIIISINRYERKKNLPLAIQSLAQLKLLMGGLDGVHLVMAGGYDSRVKENVEHYQELKKLSSDLSLDNYVTFLRSCSNDQKQVLLQRARCLLYTPSNEHFGIVPVEAMHMRCPVIAVNSGGPLETVADGETGFLCNPDASSFAKALLKLISDTALASKMGSAGKKRVQEKFSFETFTKQLHDIIIDLVK